FYWDTRQVGILSTNAPNFTANDFLKGRMRHWLHLPNSQLHVGSTLSFERGPRPSNPPNVGQKPSYDYPDTANGSPNYEGRSGSPGVIAWRDPASGQVYYKWYRRNALGLPTNIVETWTYGETTP